MPRWRHKKPKPSNWPPTCEQQLKGIDFIDGTFVEYHQVTGEELYRGTISKFSCKKNAFAIATKESDESTNFLKLGTPHLTSMESSILYCQEGVWLIDAGPWLSWQCSIAPKGIDIPLR